MDSKSGPDRLIPGPGRSGANETETREHGSKDIRNGKRKIVLTQEQ